MRLPWVGTPVDYPNPHSYLKALGLNLKERSSGKHKGQLKITLSASPARRGGIFTSPPYAGSIGIG